MADQGTLIQMKNMNRTLDVGPDTVTAEAGALYIDVAHKLQEQNLQFYVNTEIGNLSIGSAACGGTKDASMPGEFGQVCSYATNIKLVTPAGERVEITEDDPELIQVARSSYGLLGVVYEVTLRTQPIKPMAVDHIEYSREQFEREFPSLKERDESMFMYIFPFLDAIVGGVPEVSRGRWHHQARRDSVEASQPRLEHDPARLRWPGLQDACRSSACATTPSHFRGPFRPVEQVSWGDTQLFLAQMNTLGDGYTYRLPTEAEWEFAARAGTTGDYGGTGVPEEMGWFSQNSDGETHPVGTKAPQRVGPL